MRQEHHQSWGATGSFLLTQPLTSALLPFARAVGPYSVATTDRHLHGSCSPSSPNADQDSEGQVIESKSGQKTERFRCHARHSISVNPRKKNRNEKYQIIMTRATLDIAVGENARVSENMSCIYGRAEGWRGRTSHHCLSPCSLLRVRFKCPVQVNCEKHMRHKEREKEREREGGGEGGMRKKKRSRGAHYHRRSRTQEAERDDDG